MIKNIIFDLCGPILILDIGLMDKKLHDFGVTIEQPYLYMRQAGLTKDFEAGRIDKEVFCERVREVLEVELTEEQIFDAWNTVIGDCPKERLDLIRNVKRNYKTFLLSNSDEVNAELFSDCLNDTAGYDIMSEGFDEDFFSYQLKNRKPSPAVFEHIVKKHKLKMEETLVIDDCRKHCVSARTLGLYAHWLTGGETIMDLFTPNYFINTEKLLKSDINR